MSNYQITLPLGTNGTAINVLVPSGAIQSDFSLKLVGRGAPGYGTTFAENELLALNNNASVDTGVPTNPLIGQIWYNHTTLQLMHYVGVGVVGAYPVGNPLSGWASILSTSATGSGPTMSGSLNLQTLANITALGLNQNDAFQLTSGLCEIKQATDTNNGVKLPVAIAGKTVIVINDTTVPVKVYPYASSSIEANAENISVEMGAGARLQFIAISAIKWYMLSAVYE